MSASLNAGDASADALFRQRVLAEVVRALERDGAEPIEDAAAEAHARTLTEGDLERRMLARAEQVTEAGRRGESLRAALHQVNLATGWIVTLGAILALLAGVGAAFATLGRATGEGVVNFYWVLGGVLGVQTIVLVLWLVFMLAAVLRRERRGAAPAGVVSLGGVAVAAAQWVAGRFQRGRSGRAAIAAWARVHAGGRIGKWTFSSITHGLWLAFNVGCLAAVMFLLSTRHYVFVWETTILRESHYARMTHALALLPELAGFAAPDDQQIARSRWTGRIEDIDEEARLAWSSLLVGAIVIYGFGPRVLLFGFSLSRRRAACLGYRLDMTLPGYARLAERLSPHSERLGRMDEDSVEHEQSMLGASEQERPPAHARPLGPPCILGIEIDRPRDWPPRWPGAAPDDFGIIETREQRMRVLEALARGETEPAAMLIVCDLTTTPDRGIGRFIRSIGEHFAPGRNALAAILTAGHALRSRGADADAVEQRVHDWRRLCAEAGVVEDRIVELDLDHLTSEGTERLAVLAARETDGGSAIGARQVGGLSEAFNLIMGRVERWAGAGKAPDAPAQAELHGRIAALYGGDPVSPLASLGLPSVREAIASADTAQIAAHLRSSADRVLDLLPMRLKRSPKWLAAGAVAGALGCIGASLAISPVAIASLPTWSGLGAALAAVLQPSGREDASAASPDFADAVRAAALFAMLLDLQGRSEAAISRVLDAAIGPDDDAAIDGAAAARSWLDAVRGRFDVASAEAAA